ncbi:MAG: GNAT family N-acetyltransferase [Pyrinomonadaceae bacterium]
MSINIRAIERGDLQHVLELMREFARYEDLESSLEVTEERLSAAMFDEGAFVEGLIAFNSDTPIGYAIFYPNFLTFRGQRGYFLEDLYVAQESRASGLGKAFLSLIAKMAQKRGFERIDFLVLDWNETAIGFYQKLGAVRSTDERHFKFTDNAFRQLCGYDAS